MAGKAKKQFYMIRRAAKANWGFGFKSLKALYRGVGEAILLYGAPVWAHRMDTAGYAEILLRAQRTMLLTVCKGYRTAPRDALTVLAGVMPIDILAREREELYWMGRRGDWNRAEIRNRMLRLWQNRWDLSETGRRVYALFPDVKDRLRLQIDMNHYMTQFFTGHGNFNAYLKRFGIRENELCGVCGVVDTPEHVLYDCVQIADSRTQFEMSLADYGIRFDLRIVLQSGDTIRLLEKWLMEIGRIREGRERIRLGEGI